MWCVSIWEGYEVFSIHPAFPNQDGAYLGGFESLVAFLKSEWPDVTLPTATDKDYIDAAKRGFLAVLQSSGNSFAYMDIKIGNRIDHDMG